MIPVRQCQNIPCGKMEEFMSRWLGIEILQKFGYPLLYHKAARRICIYISKLFVEPSENRLVVSTVILEGREEVMQLEE